MQFTAPPRFVLRFWNHRVRFELDSALKVIWFALQQRRSSKPSPLLLSLCERERRATREERKGSEPWQHSSASPRLRGED
jgi:hypothetical protein